MSDTYEPSDLRDDQPKADHAALSKHWNAEILSAQKAHRDWIKRGEKVEKVYNDRRDTRADRRSKFNILWSNVETLRPAVYLRTPKVQVGRRYRDRDPVARFASELLQRSIQTSAEDNDFDDAIENAVRDRLLPGRGQVWLFYEPEFGQDGGLIHETAYIGYVPWKDFLHSVCRHWRENWWCGRRFYKTRRQLRSWLKERGQDAGLAEKIRLDCNTEGDSTDAGLKDERDKAQIWEIWDRDARKVCFVAPGSNEHSYLFSEAVPFDLKGFFPCPRPMLATTSSDSYVPTPDYALYQDQAEELNQLTGRISVLQKALKVAGIYDASWEGLSKLLTAGDNVMIPVENWAMRKESGGASNAVEYFPVEIVATVLQQLYQARDISKQTLYEVSGLSDVQRGATDPEETLGAQRIKAQWGTLRTRRVQKDVQRFCADSLRLIAEVIAEVFRFDTILDMAGYDQDMLAKYMPPSAAGEDALKAEKAFLDAAKDLLRSDKRSFRISVETDSTIEADEAEERKARIEIISGLGSMVPLMTVLVQQGPEGAKLAGDLILFAMRGFAKAAEIEQTVENAAEAAARKAAQPQPDPEMALKQREQQHTEEMDVRKQTLEEQKAGSGFALEVGKLEADLQGQESGEQQADADREAAMRQAERKEKAA